MWQEVEHSARLMPIAVSGAQHLTDHAALGQPAEMHAFDVEGIEQTERVVGEHVDRVRAVRRLGAAMAAAVVTQDAVALGERLHLGSHISRRVPSELLSMTTGASAGPASS